MYIVYQIDSYFLARLQKHFLKKCEMAKFVPRQRKHKVLQRHKRSNNGDVGEDASTNTLEILPAVAAERQKKKNEMKAVIKHEQPVMSTKKKKRLDKYIVSEFYLAKPSSSQHFLLRIRN